MTHKKLISLTLSVCLILSVVIYTSGRPNRLMLEKGEPVHERSFEKVFETVSNETAVLKSNEVPSAEGVNQPGTDTPSFDDLVRYYSQYDEAQLKEVLAETEQRIEKGDYIARANSGDLSERERLELAQYIRIENAIHAIRTRLLLEQHRKLDT